jgi:threonine aldolase
VPDDFETRFRAAAAAATTTVLWHPRRTPAEVLRAAAEAAEQLDLDWDRYGTGGALAMVETQLAELFGAPGSDLTAAFFPSGVMAQQCALRVWADRAGTKRIALPELSHLLVHEDDGPRRLHGFELELLSRGQALPTVESLRAIPGRLAACLLELPLRDAGCALPTWEELVDLTAAVRERGAAVHVDGARIWEAQPHWGEPLSEVMALADTMYVSFYKGLGAIAGAALLGPSDVIEEARVWRRRMGGTIFHLTAEAVTALVGLERELPGMAERRTWARAVADALTERGLRCQPNPPHTSTFLVHAPGSADAVNERLVGWMEEHATLLCGPWRDGATPGTVVNELVVAGPATERDPGEVAGWLADVVLPIQ